MKAFLLALLFLSLNKVSGQEINRYELHLDLGLCILPSNNLGGLLLGFTLENADKKIAFHLRNDIVPEFRKTPLLNTSGQQYPSYELHLISLNMLNSIEVSYRITPINKTDLRASFGTGWVYSGNGYGAYDRFDDNNGYPIITASIFFQPSWYFLELRGNMMLDDFGDYYPVSISFGVRFPPEKKE
ncbi:MAG: hypothetical protein ACK4S0_13205 [Sediminibacterium sp.]